MYIYICLTFGGLPVAVRQQQRASKIIIIISGSSSSSKPACIVERQTSSLVGKLRFQEMREARSKREEGAPVYRVCFVSLEIKGNKPEKHRMNFSGSQHKGYSQHLQYLDSVKSSAKGLSFPQLEIKIYHATFNGRYGSYATGPRPNACHVTMEVVDNTAQPAWIPTQRRSVVIQQMVASRYQLFSQPHLPNI